MSDVVHGLQYTDAFLDALPVLCSRPAPHQPIRALNAEQFAEIHSKHLTSDHPDSVLFPFLHGLEGDNEAQNSFFAGSSGLGLSRDNRDEVAKAGVVSVPKFRGLLWVACDDVGAGTVDVTCRYRDIDEDDDYDFEYDDDTDDDRPSVDALMRIDEAIIDNAEICDADNDKDLTISCEPHMHPQVERKVTAPIHIDTTTALDGVHDRRHSTSSTSTSISSNSATDSQFSNFGFSPSTSYSTAETSPTTDIEVDECIPPTTASTIPPLFVDSPTDNQPCVADHSQPKFTLTSSFSPSDLLTQTSDGEPVFIPPQVPHGISLRNFGIQLPIYATLSDIVVYSATASNSAAAMTSAIAIAERFKAAIERLAVERKRRYEEAGVDCSFVGEKEAESQHTRPHAHLVPYNVFVLTEPLSEVVQRAPWLCSRVPPVQEEEFDLFGDTTLHHTSNHFTESRPVAPLNADGSANPIHHEDTEMKDMQEGQSSSVDVFEHLNIHIDFAQREREEMRELTKATPILGDSVYLGNISDVPLPNRARMLRNIKKRVVTNPDEHSENGETRDLAADEPDPFNNSDNPEGYDLCIECRDSAIYTDSIRSVEAHFAALDALWSRRCWEESEAKKKNGEETDHSPVRPLRPPPSASHIVHMQFAASASGYDYSPSAARTFLSFLSGLISPVQHPPSTRPKKVLIYSSDDGYTESSFLALALIMRERAIDLPAAYLELHLDRGRSFFVYQSNVGPLKRLESELRREREAHYAAIANVHKHAHTVSRVSSPALSIPHAKEKRLWMNTWSGSSSYPENYPSHTAHFGSRTASNSISYPPGTNVLFATPDTRSSPSTPPHPHRVRPRARTSPLLPPHVDNQTWFNDPRFDGSFPSRVLPFLYLGNLDHAQNAYMLHALGITHVVSVGECALVPPPNIATDEDSPGYHFIAGKGPGGQGSLWVEEREGRIKVLDIKGVCDDGIDSLHHQLQPICDWIERAREEGGKILVHCRVGVSRSATVTIAYVMKHLAISLVDAYLIVRSRRLNVLIQPNMRLLYNLLGWEVKLARERVGDDSQKLRQELSKSMNWPYLAREVHRLNEKYLR